MLALSSLLQFSVQIFDQVRSIGKSILSGDGRKGGDEDHGRMGEMSKHHEKNKKKKDGQELGSILSGKTRKKESKSRINLSAVF